MADSTEHRKPPSRTLAGRSDVVFEFTCQPCIGDKKTLEAVGFCVDCSEFLCHECFKYHLRTTLTRNHKLLDIEEAKRNKDIARYQDVCTEECSKHRREIVKFLCFDHDILGCVDCMNIDHNNCQEVKYIPDIAGDIANGDEYSGLIGELNTVLLRSKWLISNATENKAKAQSHYDKILTDMKQIKKELMKALKKLEKAMQAEAEKIKLKETQKMDANIAIFDNIHHKADTLALKLRSMKNNGQYCKLLAAMKKEKYDIKTLDNKLDKAADDNHVDDHFFQPSTQLVKLMKHKSSLGKLSQQACIKSKATKIGQMSVRTDSDTFTCSIEGLASLPSDRLVAADYNNEKVKLVDVKQAKVISELKLPGNPRDMTVTDETCEIAVSLRSRCQLLLLKVKGDTLLMHRVIQTSNTCYGVASVMDNLVLSLTSPQRLEIIDKHGNVLNKIVYYQIGEEHFSSVYSVTASKDMCTLYVADYRENTVTCLSLFGKVIAVYKDNDLQRATCVAVDGRGNVYAGGEVSRNVHQITPDCRKISILLPQTYGLGKIQSLCYSTETDCLYLGQFSETILTFQLT